MHHPRLFKPESIANVQIEIQIVDTHETLEPRIVIGLQAFDYQINRTLLIWHIKCKMIAYRMFSMEKRFSVTCGVISA